MLHRIVAILGIACTAAFLTGVIGSHVHSQTEA